ncbi:MAG: radical SAM protein [Candidatus Krumholzibacteriia bacterium]
MRYVEPLFRPPSEARSLLLQVTIGCSHNACTYCGMYQSPRQRFRVRSLDAVKADIDEAGGALTGPVPRVFLADGDALVVPPRRLAAILEHLRRRIPSVRRVGIYGDARSILRWSVEELRCLRELGLGIVYHGAESGDDEVLRRVGKGSTAAEAVRAARRLRAAGIRHSVMVMLGLGGVERSREHAAATAELITHMDPPYVGALTTMLVPGTPLAADAAAGRFRLPDRWGMLRELRTLVAESRPSRCAFHANHASNHLPLRLNLPADRGRGTALLDEVLASRDESRLLPEQWRGL